MKILKDKQGIETLYVTEKQQAICPFKPVLIVPNGLGQPQQAMQNCNNTCPHFHFGEESQKVQLTCGATLRVINLKSDIQQ